MLGIGLYVACDLVNAALDDTETNVVQLVQEAFCKALHLKIKQSYPIAVKQLKYNLKFRKVSNKILHIISRVDIVEAADVDEHEQRLLLDSLFKT